MVWKAPTAQVSKHSASPTSEMGAGFFHAHSRKLLHSWAMLHPRRCGGIRWTFIFGMRRLPLIRLANGDTIAMQCT